MDDQFGPSDYATLKELCYHLCSSLRDDARKNIARSACSEILNSQKSNEDWNDSIDNDEFTVIANIEKQLISLNRGKDIPRFRYLSSKLGREEFAPLLSKRKSILNFFLNVSEGKHCKEIKEASFIRKAFSSAQPKLFLSPSSSTSSFKGSGDVSDHFSLSHNGISSGHSPHIPSATQSSRPTTLSNNIFLKRDAVLKTPTKPILVQPAGRGSPSSYRSGSHDSLSLFASPQYSKYKKAEVSERSIMIELLYCFIGIEGNILKLDHNLGFTIDPQVCVPHRQMVEKLMELGFLHNSVVHQSKGLEKGGTVGRAVLTAIKKILTEYYALIGSFHSESLQTTKTSDDTPLSEDGSEEMFLSLRRLYFLTQKPMRLLQCVYDALNAIRNMRGSSITTALDILRHHESYRHIVPSLIIHAGRPILNMIVKWMVEGELFDPMGEFFITLNTNCHERDIWRDKFVLRQDLIPNVMSEEQAQMILRSGKAIHFLNVICGKQTPITGSRERLHTMEELNLLDLCEPRSKLNEIIASIFVETSKQVLDTLVNQFKLYQHFQGLRRYILLGQGDFVNYYMELVEPEMRKPANQLQFHELMSLKSLAERATLAHYEDPEILNRVSVKLLVASGGDWGSDVFGLQYLMHEPLDAALKLSDGAYSHMFNFLWRIKRMEYILLSLRKERWATKNSLNWLADREPYINSVLVVADRLSHELLHFAREFHYYILFEVVECLWEKFSHSFTKAKSFDDVIRAHDDFINEMQAKTFQDKDSRTFINELRLIWDLVFELETQEMTFFSHVAKEYNTRVEREAHIAEHGTCEETEAQAYESDQKFKAFLSRMRVQYNILNTNYQDVLKRYLLELSSTMKHELRLLSSRIDYNEYYKRLDARLTESMKYSRCSDLFN